MNVKKYFTGRTGLVFWGNLLLALLIVAGIPYVAFLSLGACTHHGEKIEVPNVVEKPRAEAVKMLEEADLVPVFSDSIYDKSFPKGAILAQNPTGGSTVKSGRYIYLTVNMNGYPPVEMPDLARNSTERIASIRLRQMGFTLNASHYVEGETPGYVISIHQGGRVVVAGEKVYRDKPLTLYVGKEMVDTLRLDEDIYKPLDDMEWDEDMVLDGDTDEPEVPADDTVSPEAAPSGEDYEEGGFDLDF